MSKKGEDLTRLESAALRILQQHNGYENAISGPALAKKLKVNCRKVREIINHLIIDHLLPVASSTHPHHAGYFLVATPAEAKQFYLAFRKRGITGLMKAARMEKTTLLEMSLQLSFDQYQDDEEGQKIPGAGEAAAKLLKLFLKNKKLYSKEIAALGDQAAPLLIDREKIKKINAAAKRQEEAAKELRELTSL